MALSSSATFVSNSPELSASAKEFVPGETFAGTGTQGAASCTGFHFDPSACEFSPAMMANPYVPAMPAMPVCMINFSDYSSDEEDTPRPSPPPITKTAQKVELKVETPVATDEFKSSIASTDKHCDTSSAKTTNELCKDDTAVAPWKRIDNNQQDNSKTDTPKSPASKDSPKSPASKDGSQSPASKDSEGKVADNRPWRKSSTTTTDPETSSKPWRPWHDKSKNDEEDSEAVSANLSDASTETPLSMGASSIEQTPLSIGAGSPKSLPVDQESADDADSEDAPSPCSKSRGNHQESTSNCLTANLSGYLGPQRARAHTPGTFSVAEMLRWRTVSLDLKVDNFTYSTDVVDTAELPPATDKASKAPRGGYQKGGWREDARKSRTVRRAEFKQEEEASWREEEPAPLKKSDNSWAMIQEQRRKAKALNPEGKTDDEIIRSMKSILNKLTIEKYDKLYLQMLNTGISTVEHVKILIHEVMEKAQTQHHFIEMYSTFCVHLHEWFNENQVSDDPKTGFKRILLNECQSLFERCLKKQDTSDLQGEELEEAKAKYKLTMLGNIKFVGSLLGKRMLATSVLVAIAEDLITDPCSPEALESLSVFLTSVGGTFDRPDWQHHKRLEAIFDQLEKKKSDKKVPARIRFLIQDVLDLRASGWEDQKKATKKIEGPMKLEDVHEKASQEELSKSQWTEPEKPWRETRSSLRTPSRAY